MHSGSHKPLLHFSVKTEFMSTTIDPQIIKRNRIIFFLVLAIGFLVFFLVKCSPDRPEPKPTVQIKTVIREVVVDSIRYQKKIDSLKKSEQYWMAKATAGKKETPKVQSETKKKIEEVKEAAASNDTTALVARIEELEILNEQKDSLHNAVTSAQDSVIANKDQQLAASADFNSKLRSSFDSAVVYGKQVENQSKYWKKKYRKTRAGNVLLKIGAVAAAAIIVKQSL